VTEGVVVTEGEGRLIELPGWSMLVKIGADDTGGTLSVVHGHMAATHAGPSEHVHDGHDETFFVVAGSLRFRLGDSYHRVDAGSTVFAPRGRAHGFSNPFDRPATYVVTLTPAGYERYFAKVAGHFKRTGALPDQATSAAWMAETGTRPALPV
jgi:mannose-6-phosphate isomerase-like protein (cupin superfamily)